MGRAVAWLVVCVVCVRKGRVEHAEGREPRGQARAVYARKNTEALQKPLAASERLSLLLSCVSTRKKAPQAYIKNKKGEPKKGPP